MKSMEHFLEVLIFNSRWLLAPFYLGLIVGMVILLVKFFQEFVHLIPHTLDSSESDVVLAILTLVDMSLVANLLLIIVFSGYENFVSKIDTAGHEDRPDWMGKVDFSGLKMKVIASIVAISAIELLKAFVNIGAQLDAAFVAATAAATSATVTGANATAVIGTTQWTWTLADKSLFWKVVIHFVLVFSGVLFALMDRIASSNHAPAMPEAPDDAHKKH